MTNRNRSDRSQRSVAVMVSLIIAFCCSSVGLGSEGSRQRAFLQAVEAFEGAKSAEDYRKSAQVFESLLSDGFQSGVVYYNLGNAYFRAGDFGHAILNYRKSKLLRPRDPYLDANLRQAIAMAPGKLTEAGKPWWGHVLFWSGWIGLSTKANLATFGLIAAALIGFVGLFMRIQVFYWAALAALTVSIAVGVDLALTSPDLLAPKLAVVVRETMARKGTDDRYEPAFDKPLRDGAEFTILDDAGEWTFGHFEGVGDGWVRNDTIAR
ncbi:MAG: tetratricopeptide repeat protein [Pirellula sp.]